MIRGAQPMAQLAFYLTKQVWNKFAHHGGMEDLVGLDGTQTMDTDFGHATAVALRYYTHIE